MSATTEQEVLSGILPHVTIEKIVLESIGQNQNSTQENRTLKVTLHLTVKEILDDNLLGSWFDSQDFKKYIKIDVVQSINKQVTDALSFSNDMITICNQFHIQGSVDIESIVTQAFAYSIGNSSLSTIQNILEENTELKQISLTEYSRDIIEAPSYLNSEGQTVYEIPYNVVFDNFNTLNPQHLAYFVVASLDIRQICEDYQINYQQIVSEGLGEFGRVYSEIVIDNFNVSNQSYIYTDQNNAIWHGPVHQTANNTFKSGDEETPESILLKRFVVRNSKIQDFRNFEEIEKRIFDFIGIGESTYDPDQDSTTNNSVSVSTSLEQTLNRVRRIAGADFKLSGEKPKFTNFFISRDFRNNVKFLFGINFKNIIKENTKFGSLIENNAALNECLLNTKILDLKFYRKRVKNNFKINNSVAKYEYENFDPNQIDELLFQTGDDRTLQDQVVFLSVDNNKASIRETNLALSIENPFMRYFTGADKTMSEVSDGIYQYYVVMDIEDKITEYFNKKLINLQTLKNEINVYYNIMSKPTMRRFYIESSDPHIQTQNINSNSPDIIDYGFDPISNKFSTESIISITSMYASGQAPWNLAPASFVEVLSIFSQNTTLANNEIIRLALTNFLDPNTANPGSILKTIEIFDYLIESVSKFLGVSTDTVDLDPHTNNNAPSGTAGSKNSKTFKITKYFDNVDELVNSNVLESYGIEYLSPSFSSDSSGLATLNYNTFYRRISREMLKFFNNENPFLNFSTEERSAFQIKYSYLTPVRIDILNNSIVTTPSQQIISANNRTIQYFYNNAEIVNLAASMQSDILNFKLDVNGKNTYKTVNRRGNLNREQNRKMNSKSTSEKITQIFADYGNMTILEHNLLTDTTKQLSPSQISVNNIINSKELLQFMNCLIDGPLKSRKNYSSFYNTNRINLKESIGIEDKIIANRATDYIKLIALTEFDISTSASLSVEVPDAQTTVPGSRAGGGTIGRRPNLTGDVDPNAPSANNVDFNRVRFAEFLNDETPTNIPLQLRGLMFKDQLNQNMFQYSSYVNVDFPTYNKNKLINYFNYEMINKIEYLKGYETTIDGDLVANEEIWEMLDFNSLDSFARDGREILCRMVPYQSDAIYPKPNLEIENNSYNKYFILRTSDVEPEQDNGIAPPIVGRLPIRPPRLGPIGSIGNLIGNRPPINSGNQQGTTGQSNVSSFFPSAIVTNNLIDNRNITARATRDRLTGRQSGNSRVTGFNPSGRR